MSVFGHNRSLTEGQNCNYARPVFAAEETFVMIAMIGVAPCAPQLFDKPQSA